MKLSDIVGKKSKESNNKTNSKPATPKKITKQTPVVSNEKQDKTTIDGIEYTIIDKEPIDIIHTNDKYLYFNSNRYEVIDGYALNIDNNIIKVKNDIYTFNRKYDVIVNNIRTSSLYLITKGYKLNKPIKKENYYPGDYILKDNNLFIVYALEPKEILAKPVEDIHDALATKHKYIYVKSNGKFYINNDNYIKEIEKDNFILKSNNSPLPIGSNIIYNGNRYKVYSNTDNMAILARVDGEPTEGDIVYRDGNYFYFISSNYIDAKIFYDYKDYVFSSTIESSGKYIIKNNAHIYIDNLNDFDTIDIFTLDTSSITSDCVLFEDKNSIKDIPKYKKISFIYFNERLHLSYLEK